jgi:predicted DNA-binding ribbon-helix-helix protein
LFARDDPITLTISGLAVCERNRMALPADACACVSEGVQMMISQRDVRTPVTDPVKEFAVVKRSVVVEGHKTSVSLEDAFWSSLKDIAARRGLSLSMQIAAIDQHRRTSNLSSAIRLFVLDYFRERAIGTMFIGERQAAPKLTPAH